MLKPNENTISPEELKQTRAEGSDWVSPLSDFLMLCWCGNGGIALHVVRGKQEARLFWIEWWFILTVALRNTQDRNLPVGFTFPHLFLLHMKSPNPQQRHFKQAEAVLLVSGELGAAQLLSSWSHVGRHEWVCWESTQRDEPRPPLWLLCGWRSKD